jgi:vitamin B12/bleomycin/antimicrobial peptide transport system ATP-binding/permease protein
MTVLLSKSSVWLAEAYANFFNHGVNLIKGDGAATLEMLIGAGAAWGAIVAARALGVGTRHMVASNLNRLASGWRVEQFNSAAFDEQRSHFSLTSDKTVGLPDHLDQRVQECTRAVDGAAIGLTMGALGTVSSLWFVGMALYARSAPIEGLEFLGPFANSFAFAIALALAYVTPSTWIATSIGKVLQRLTIERQERDGAWRGELSQVFHRSLQIASSSGEHVQAWINRQLYARVNSIWFKQTIADSGFQGFNHAYNEVKNDFVKYIPFFPSAMQGSITFENYIAGSELTRELINDMSWFIQVMPAIANIRADAQRLSEFAAARERVNDWQSFHREHGVCDFSYLSQDPAFGLRVRNLELMCKGHDATAFLTARNLKFRPGTWTMLIGDNGCGKSSFLKAATGLWGYGRGQFVYPADCRTFFAGQKADISSQLTLKELAAYPKFKNEFMDIEFEQVFRKVGLELYLEHMDARLYRGKTWQSVLSGGQEQKLVLARILLQKPDILFLDEATSDLSPAAANAFHQAIKDELPDTIVISIMHTDQMPKFRNGHAVFDQILYIENGEAETYPGYEFNHIVTRMKMREEFVAEHYVFLEKDAAATRLTTPELQ